MADEDREAKADARAEKARAKALRPWYKKKRLLIPLGVLVLIVIASLGSQGGSDNEGREQAQAEGSGEEEQPTPEETRLFPGRADAQNEDQERRQGQSAQVSGRSATVRAAEFREALQVQSGGFIVADITIENVSDDNQTYNALNWRIQTPNGQVKDAVLVNTLEDALGSGDLVEGGSVSGIVAFEVGDTKGDFYIIWKPDVFDAARGIWKVAL